MGIGHLFKLPKHREFQYRPRHFDPAMEDLHQRVKESEKKYAEKTNVPGSSIKGKMKEYRMNTRSTAGKMKFVRWVITLFTIVLLILIFYFIVEFMGYFYDHA